MTSASGTPIARNFDMVVIMFTTALLMLPVCQSVEMESGMKPFWTAGAAFRNQKLA